jgi:ankyrin repeat protein
MSDPDRKSSASAFDRLRSAAKTLTRAARSGDPAALARVRAQLPRLAALDPAEAVRRVRLSDVQHALAREAGVENWAALKELVLAQEPLIAQVERMHRALLEGDRAAAASILRSHPEVPRSSIHAACGATDRAAVEAWLARDPSLALAKHGGSGWTPLDCLAASPVFDLDDERRVASAAIGGRLLDLGADANTFTRFGDDPNTRLSVLYRASQNGNAGLVRLLLEHGADPNDGESMYHAAERNHREVMELLLAHGAEISARHPHWNNTVLYFLSGNREGQPMTKTANAGMQWLLEHGADPNAGSYDLNETPLHRIAEFGRAADLAELLLAHGADPRAARTDGRTPYELAMRVGNRPVAELLRARGAAVESLRPEDALLAACAAGDFEAARAVAGAHPGLVARMTGEEPAAIVRAAGDGSAHAVPVLAAVGYDFSTEGPWGGTALHWAAWHGHVALVRALITAGSPINRRDRTYGSSPIAWAAHGSRNCRSADDEYATIVDLLLDAGSERPPSINKWNAPPEAFATDPVLDRLRARGFSPEES